MANNYIQFSATIECTPRQAKWLDHELMTAVEGDEGERYSCCDIAYFRDDGCIWVSSSGEGDINALLETVSAFQLLFRTYKPWSIQWSWTCSSPRVGEFGGGGAVVYKGEIHSVDAYQWCADKVKELHE